MAPSSSQWQLTGSAADHYERFAVGRYLGALAELFVDRIGPTRGQRVIDVACGTGIVARQVAPFVLPGGRIVGLDLNPSMLATARRVARDAGLAIEWLRGDAARLPFSAESFDLLLCQQGLQFVPDPVRVLREFARVLVPEGIVGLNVSGPPNAFQLALAEGLAQQVDRATAQVSLAPFAMGDASALRALVAAAGFGNISLETVTLTRRVEPTQAWLCQYSAGLPYGAVIAAMDPAERAALVRAVAQKLRAYWANDSFAVPWDVHIVIAKP